MYKCTVSSNDIAKIERSSLLSVLGPTFAPESGLITGPSKRRIHKMSVRRRKTLARRQKRWMNAKIADNIMAYAMRAHAWLAGTQFGPQFTHTIEIKDRT